MTNAAYRRAQLAALVEAQAQHRVQKVVGGGDAGEHVPHALGPVALDRTDRRARHLAEVTTVFPVLPLYSSVAPAAFRAGRTGGHGLP